MRTIPNIQRTDAKKSQAPYIGVLDLSGSKGYRLVIALVPGDADSTRSTQAMARLAAR
jgi:hypothetical protein